MEEFLDSGYPAVHKPEHPLAKQNGTIRTHRLIAEEKLGRPLKPGEVVHHIDENKQNNDPDNLMVFVSNSAHITYHWTHECTQNEDGIFDSIPQKYFCEKCGKELGWKAKLCEECFKKEKAKHIPSKEELESLAKQYNGNFVEIAKLFNKSDNTIRKWFKKAGLPYHSFDYRSKKEKKEPKDCRKPVNQLNLETGEIIATFPSSIEAARSLGKKKGTHITEVCKGKLKAAYGYGWEYKK